jgi:hypothetical protein
MTRKSPREIESALDDLAPAGAVPDDEQVVIYRTVVDHDGTPQETRRTVIDL